MVAKTDTPLLVSLQSHMKALNQEIGQKLNSVILVCFYSIANKKWQALKLINTRQDRLTSPGLQHCEYGRRLSGIFCDKI